MNNNIEDKSQIITEREHTILFLLVEGLNNNEIAKKLYISANTVKFHVSSLIKKFNAKNRTNVVYLAAKENIV